MAPDAFSLPTDFSEWMPAAQAVSLGLATWVQEDVPTVTAALLAAAGRLAWQTGFIGCFLGIWIGDVLLYLAARTFGRPMLRYAWTRRWAPTESVARSERWFAERGTWLLITSRFVPGLRLPTYLAAGFLGLPFPRFVAMTGILAAVWTAGIFAAAQLFGPQLTDWLQRWNLGGWWILLGAVVIAVALRAALRAWHGTGARALRTWIGRWRRWEFWPAWLFYLPVAINYFRLSVKYRGVMLPAAANPGIEGGGLVGESKYATLRELMRTSPEFTAEAWRLDPGEASDRQRTLESLRSAHAIDFPFVLKPDVGQRGAGVRVIRSESDIQAYLRHTAAALVVQRYVPGPLELGVFYVRSPEEATGRIFAITEKIFPELTGDGVHTVDELIRSDPRARFVAARYLERFASRRDEVLPAGQTLRLVEAGNHAQGCVFRDGARFNTEPLAERFDAISKRLPGFFVGRYDVRFSSEAELRAGRGFSILELNGAAAEATNIYDARTSLWSAYRTLFAQWELVFAIGATNRARGTTAISVRDLWRRWRTTNRLIAGYPVAD
jgi:membrane protein DedA with SNARE-associated domain